MPAKSQAQFRYMKGVAAGSIRAPKGLSRAEADEYTAGQSPKELPEKVSGKKLQRKRQMKKRGKKAC